MFRSFLTLISAGNLSLLEPVLDVCFYVHVCFCRLCWGTLAFQLLCLILEPAELLGCSFFCRKSQRFSPPSTADPGSPLFLTPYLERGAIDEGRTPRQRKPQTACISVRLISLLLSARKLSLVGELPGANVKSYAGYLTVNKKYNSNLFFWFFPALKVGLSPWCTPKALRLVLVFIVRVN